MHRLPIFQRFYIDDYRQLPYNIWGQSLRYREGLGRGIVMESLPSAEHTGIYSGSFAAGLVNQLL